jgi:hypothetical protein
MLSVGVELFITTEEEVFGVLREIDSQMPEPVNWLGSRIRDRWLIRAGTTMDPVPRAICWSAGVSILHCEGPNSSKELFGRGPGLRCRGDRGPVNADRADRISHRGPGALGWNAPRSSAFRETHGKTADEEAAPR